MAPGFARLPFPMWEWSSNFRRAQNSAMAASASAAAGPPEKEGHHRAETAFGRVCQMGGTLQVSLCAWEGDSRIKHRTAVRGSERERERERERGREMRFGATCSKLASVQPFVSRGRRPDASTCVGCIGAVADPHGPSSGPDLRDLRRPGWIRLPFTGESRCRHSLYMGGDGETKMLDLISAVFHKNCNRWFRSAIWRLEGGFHVPSTTT